jgi:chaperonin GroEL (HSP60 family)
VLQECVRNLASCAVDFSVSKREVPQAFAERVLRQNLGAKLSAPAAEQIVGLLGSNLLEWLSHVPNRPSFSSIDYRPRNFHAAIAPGGYIRDSYLFSGIVLKKDFASPNHPSRMKGARIVLTREKLYTDKPGQDHLGAEYQISTPIQLQEFKHRELVVAPTLPSVLGALGVNVLITEKGISDAMLGLLDKEGILVVRRAKLKQMVKLAKALGVPLAAKTAEVTAEDVGVSPNVTCEKVRGDWRVFVETDPAEACTLVIRCSSYEVGAEVRRVVKSALRATLESLHGGVFLPGAGGWMALAVNFCNHAECGLQQARDAAAFGFFSLLQALAANAGADPIDVPLEVVARNRGHEGSYAGIHFPTGKVAPLGEIGVYDSLRAVRLAIEHARQFVSSLLNVDQIFHYDKKPLRD